jgi:sugar lactone lactonase YvrE
MAELISTVEVMFDGCTADEEGAIWAADPKNARCIRIQEGGEIVDEVPAPDGLNIFACMLGGDDGRTLLLCVAPGLANNDRGFDATLRTVTVAVPHGGRP